MHPTQPDWERVLGRLNAVEAELETLRRSRRRAQGLAAALGVAALAAWTLAAAAMRPAIKAQSFVLTDLSGATRAVLGLRNGQPSLSLLDGNNQVRALLEVSAKGPYLRLLDGNGRLRASLSATDMGPALTELDANGQVRVGLGDLGGGPNLTLLDDKGSAVLRTH